jgi:hypothetical protein
MPSDMERYRHANEECRAKAALSQHVEIAQLWSQIAASYAFLLNREERLAAERAERRDPIV